MPDWYIEYYADKMVSFESDVESEYGIYEDGQICANTIRTRCAKFPRWKHPKNDTSSNFLKLTPRNAANLAQSVPTRFRISKDEREKGEKDEVFVEEEAAGDLLGESTARALRTLGAGLDDTELLRADTQEALDVVHHEVRPYLIVTFF